MPAECSAGGEDERRDTLKTSHIKVSNSLCGECSLALRRFVGGMDGVASVDVENGMIDVRFDESAIDEGTLLKITKDSIERLGYRVEE